jgi:hypothetical protein
MVCVVVVHVHPNRISSHYLANAPSQTSDHKRHYPN